MMGKVIFLTVAEAKRLIAKGLLHSKIIQEKLVKGIIAICKGSTNSYLVEEILKKTINKINYTTGLSLPYQVEIPQRENIPDLVLIDGKPVENLSVIEAVKEMKPGDIFIKGGNALNYEKKQVGILIAHPQSGTIGATLGIIIAQKINLTIPISLEKLVFEDIFKLSNLLSQYPNTLSLMPLTGTIFTEIETIKTLANLEVKLISKGGLLGGEGGIRLLLNGEKKEIDKISKILEDIYGEPALNRKEIK